MIQSLRLGINRRKNHSGITVAKLIGNKIKIFSSLHRPQRSNPATPGDCLKVGVLKDMQEQFKM